MQCSQVQETRGALSLEEEQFDDDDDEDDDDDDDDHDGDHDDDQDEDDNETSLQHPGGFPQLITLGAVSVSQHNGFRANEPKQTATKLTSAGQTSAAGKFATLRFRNSDATRSELCLRSAALCATVCGIVRGDSVFGWAVPINAPTKPQHSLITAFTAALIHVDRPHCE